MIYFQFQCTPACTALQRSCTAVQRTPACTALQCSCTAVQRTPACTALQCSCTAVQRTPACTALQCSCTAVQRTAACTALQCSCTASATLMSWFPTTALFFYLIYRWRDNCHPQLPSLSLYKESRQMNKIGQGQYSCFTPAMDIINSLRLD